MSLYQLDENKRVIEGHYQGEVASSCNKFSGTLRIPGVQITADEAKNIRTRLNMGQEYLHLDKEALREGTYCINIENPSNTIYLF